MSRCISWQVARTRRSLDGGGQVRDRVQTEASAKPEPELAPRGTVPVTVRSADGRLRREHEGAPGLEGFEEGAEAERGGVHRPAIEVLVVVVGKDLGADHLDQLAAIELGGGDVERGTDVLEVASFVREEDAVVAF